MSTTEAEAGMSAGRMDGERRLMAPGAVSGVAAGLTVALRDVWLASTWASFSQLPAFAREAGTLLFAGTVIGLVLGTLVAAGLPAVSQLLSRLTSNRLRPSLDTLSLIAIAVAAVGLRLLIPYEIVQLWLDIGILATVLLAINPRLAAEERVSAVAWAVSVGAAIAVMAVILFPALSLIDEVGPGLLRMLASLLAVVAVMGATCGVFWVLRSRLDSVARRLGTVVFAALACGIMMLPGVVLGGWYVWFQRAEIELLLAQMPPPQAGWAEGPNVILISVDSLRADAPGYAGGVARTPVMDALAAESYTFTRAYSVAPWTRPSFAALFSGLYPSEMGVARALGSDRQGVGVVPYRWREEPPLLAEMLRDAGYRTAALVTNGQLTTAAAADQGFDFFHNLKMTAPGPLPLRAMRSLRIRPMRRSDLERADYVSPRAVRVLEELAGGPKLFWTHYMDPHEPYDAPSAPPEKHAVAGRKSDVEAGLTVRSGPERQRYVDAYNHEVEFFDNGLETLLDYLKTSGLWDNSIVVFWSDHGEEFWEHGGWEHGQSLYDELVRVPLIIHLPGQVEGVTIDAPVSLLDVVPTVLELTGVEAPSSLRGRSLAPIFKGRLHEMEQFSVFLESCFKGSLRKGLVNDRYKLIYDTYDESFALYDLLEDPGELRDIWGRTEAPDTSAMEADLLEWVEYSLAIMEVLTGSGAERIPEDVRRELRDMGYMQ